MSREEAYGLLEAVRGNVKKGIYAVEKQNQIELLNIEVSSSTALKKIKDAYKKQGFKVYSNG